MTWTAAPSRPWLPRATYVPTGLDRLDAWRLELAARLRRDLVEAGCRVLNDPARWIDRVSLLRLWHGAGLNDVAAWPAAEAAETDAFPAFVRTVRAHRGNLTDPLPEAPSLQGAIALLVAEGHPVSDLGAIQYRAAPREDGVFRKGAVIRIGDRLLGTPSVFERRWTTKYGEAGGKAHADELASIDAVPEPERFAAAFDAADVRYGRIDYGETEARLHLHELDTNPDVQAPMPHPFPDREAPMVDGPMVAELPKRGRGNGPGTGARTGRAARRAR